MTLHPPPIADLGRDRVAPSDREHALDRRGVGRVAARRSQPAATARRARAGGGRRASAAGIGRVEPTRQLVEQVGVVAQQIGLAGTARHDVALGDVVEQRAAPRGAPGCGGTAGRRSSRRAPVGARARCTAHASRRGAAPAAGGVLPAHAGEAVEAGAAQQVEQHGLGLVVGGVAQ